MVDNVKEFIDDYQATVPNTGTLTLDVANTDATTQNVVRELNITLSSEEQAKTAVLNHNGHPINTWTAARGTDLDVTLSGTQLVDVSSTLELDVTGEKYYAPVTFLGLSTASAAHKEYTTTVETPAAWDPAGAQTDLIESAGVSSVAANQAVRCNWKGVDRVAIMTANTGVISIREFSDVNVSVESLTAVTNAFCVAADDTYVYTKDQNSNTTLHRFALADGTQDTLTMDTAITGRSQSGGGSFFCFGGFLYNWMGGAVTTMYKVNLTTGAVTTIAGLPTPSTYVMGSVLTTTTHATPKNLLVRITSAGYTSIDLATDTVYEDITADPLLSTTFYGNAAVELMGGVVWCKASNGNRDVVIDLNGVSGTYTTTTTSFYTQSLLNIGVAFIPLSQGEVSADDLTHTTYASGVTIT